MLMMQKPDKLLNANLLTPLKQSADQIRRNFFPPAHNSFRHHSHLGCTWFFRKQQSADLLKIICS